jgi:hypothetical protein
MPELVCPRCQPGASTLTQVITCMASAQANIANPDQPGALINMPAVNTDAMRFPYFGKARSQNLIGSGFVIGFKEEIAQGNGRNGKGNRWRLDYDEIKGLHVNFESDHIPKMAHRFARIDTQPFVAKTCPFPDGMKNLSAEEQVKRMWFSWTRLHVYRARQIDEVVVGMGSAYADLGVKSADAFIGQFTPNTRYENIAHLLKPTG